VIRTSATGVELLHRDAQGVWPERPLTIASGTFELSSIGLTLPVAALYRGTGMTNQA
jgi:hypothetical protein